MNRFNTRALMAASALCIATLAILSAAQHREAPQPSWAQMLRDADGGRVASVRLERRAAWWLRMTEALRLPLRSTAGLHSVFFVSYRQLAPGRAAPVYDLAEPHIPTDELNDDLRRIVRDGAIYDTSCGLLK